MNEKFYKIKLIPRIIAGAVLFIAALFIGIVWLKTVLFILAAIIAGYDVAVSAFFTAAKKHAFDENLLMTIAAIGAFTIGESPEGAAVMILYQIGEYLQERAVNNSRKSISGLMDLRPETVTVLSGSRQITTAASEVEVGEEFLVAPGERVALDGTVLDGVSELDTSALTGESMPRLVEPGSEVMAGCVNISGALRLRATANLADSAVSRILRLVEEAEEKKAPTERFITRFAKKYTPTVLGIALFLAVLVPLIWGQPFSEWLHRALVFLVISCPCALVISVPLTFFAGIGGAAKRGVLFKGADSLDEIAKATSVVFDKTGTLTVGRFSVTEVIPNGIGRDQLLTYAACAEAFSTHPIARSIVAEYGGKVDASLVTRCREIRGKGVAVEIGGVIISAGNAALMKQLGVEYTHADTYGSVVYVAAGKRYAGCIVLEDAVKPDAVSAVSRLHELGVDRVVIITGDRREPAEAAGARLGISEVYAECLPEDKAQKLAMLRDMQLEGDKLVYVGDGINDAPVLASADIGVAMGGLGSDAAIEAADVVVMTDEPSKVAEAIMLARATKEIAKQNIIFALGVKAVIMILGVFGIANMWFAVFADVGVALLAVMNAMRAYGGESEIKLNFKFKKLMKNKQEAAPADEEADAEPEKPVDGEPLNENEGGPETVSKAVDESEE